MTGETGNRWM